MPILVRKQACSQFIQVFAIIINDMKKYSSYADLKLAPTPKSQPEYWPHKLAQTPSGRLVAQIPLMMISKQPFGMPLTAKYSGGYLQRRKMFSSRKENKDEMNIVRNGGNESGHNYGKNQKSGPLRVIDNNNSNKLKKQNEQREKGMKKEKSYNIGKQLEIIAKENMYAGKSYRMEVQSPKGVPNINREQKSKSKAKLNESQRAKDKSHKAISLFASDKHSKKNQDDLKDYVTKYEPQQKGLLMQCTSEANLKIINQQDKKVLKGYYKSAVYSAVMSAKPTSFSQICRSHLITSIQFLSYVKKNRHIMPSTFTKVNLPPTTRKTLIFDLDETLIHCNQSLDLPHDILVEIVFPNSNRIKAGINIRPYAVECLRELSKYFEIIVFTASHECYANVIINYLDPKREFISHSFFRETCHKTVQGFYVKDLRVFNRDLANVLLIDNAAYSYCFQPENGVPIVPFYNNKADLELKQITGYLRQFKDCKNMRAKNDAYMRLGEYHRFSCPKQLINQLYF